MESFKPIFEDINWINELLNNRMHIDTLDTKNGMALLHFAASYNKIDIVKYLLDKGADVNVCDIAGDTPLHYAAYIGSIDVATCLLDCGAVKNMPDNQDRIAVIIASRYGKKKIAEFIESYEPIPTKGVNCD